MNPFFIGIDVSKNSNSIHVLNELGDKVFSMNIYNSPQGLDLLFKKLLSLDDNPFFFFGMEATSNYGDHLVMSINEFFPIGCRSISIINAFRVSEFKKIFNEIPKTDPMDAFVIANFLFFHRKSLKDNSLSEAYYSIKQLTRLRYHCSNDLSRLKNRFLNTLFLKFSSLSQLQSSNEPVFSNTFGATCLSLIDDFGSVDDIAY